MKTGKAKKLIAAVCLGILCCFLGLTACTAETEKEADEGLTVSVSIVPERTFVEAVCGELVNVAVMVPPGSSPANYEPSASQMELLGDSGLYFAVGVAAEEAGILSNVGEARVVRLQDEVSRAYPDLMFESGGRDPHIWLSPKRAAVMVKVIAREISAEDPENAGIYEKNADDFIARLQALDEETKEVFVNLEGRAFIIYHPSFGYYADDYGLVMHALEVNGKQPTVGRLRELTNLAKENGVGVVYYQEETDSSQAMSFAEEIDGIAVSLSPLAADYIGNLEHTAQLLAEGMK